MPKEIVIPNIGESGIEIKFLGWLKSNGDYVKEGESLFELDAIKSVIEIPAFASGILTDLRVKTDDIVTPQQVVAILLDPGESYKKEDEKKVATIEKPATKEKKYDGIIIPSPLKANRKVNATPKAKKTAAELRISLNQVKGTGLNGLITTNDVLRLVDSGNKFLEKKINIRNAVSELTTRSWQNIPHFYLRLDADLTKVYEHGKPMAIICHAIARVLHETPDLNIAWQENELMQQPSVNLGILVATPKGLLLPTISDADLLSLDDMQQRIDDITIRARGDSLQLKDYGKRSITISNLGMHSVDQFNAILSIPDILLLSIGRIRILPVWDEKKWVPRKIASLTLSVDHRAMDGTTAAMLFDKLELILYE